MNCFKCGAEIPAGASFCVECGTSVENKSNSLLRRSEKIKSGVKKFSTEKHIEEKYKDQLKKVKESAYLKGMQDIVSFFVDCCDIDLDDIDGSPAIVNVVYSDSIPSTEIIKNLLDKGADIDAYDRNGDTALLVACRENKNKVAKYLIDAGADVDAENDYGETPISIARENDNRYLVGLLRKAGAYEEDDD